MLWRFPVNNNGYVNFICKICNKATTIKSQSLKKRRICPNQPICGTCYKEKFSRGGLPDKNYYPKELQDIWLDKVWPYERVYKFFPILKTKKQIEFKCVICGKIDRIKLNKMKWRKICGTKPICRKCALSYATNTAEWKCKNSMAQLVSQNKPEVIEKQRQAQERLMKEDPLYIEKRRSNSFIAGKINDIYFDSSWELFYIVYCFENKNIESINRYNGYLIYKDVNGRKRRYFPDFIVKYKDGNRKIIEIKGNKNVSYIKEKSDVAQKTFGMEYETYNQKDLYNMGLKVRTVSFLKEWYGKIFKNYNIKLENNEVTRRLMNRIKSNKWRK